MKKLLMIWVKGSKDFLPFKLPPALVLMLSERLRKISNAIPDCFVRRPRGMDEIERWKATEFRQFLLYTGRIVLEGVLDKRLYTHFLSLSIAMTILLDPMLVAKDVNVSHAENLLKFFAEEGCALYGSRFMVYNVHILLHLADDARVHGALDLASCFPFENYLQKLKNMVSMGRSPLSQVIRRIKERERYFKASFPSKEEKIFANMEVSTCRKNNFC
jgi:hypothetical protein